MSCERHRENVTSGVLYCLGWSYQLQNQNYCFFCLSLREQSLNCHNAAHSLEAQNYTVELSGFVFFRHGRQKSYQTVTPRPLLRNGEKTSGNLKPSRMLRCCFDRHTYVFITSSTLASSLSVVCLVQREPKQISWHRSEIKNLKKEWDRCKTFAKVHTLFGQIYLTYILLYLSWDYSVPCFVIVLHQ